MNYDINFTLQTLLILIKYLPTTLMMTIISALLSLLLGLLIAILRIKKVKVLDKILLIYISFFRGTPLLVQLFLLYYGLPQIFPSLVGLSAFSAAIIGLSFHYSAYMAEIFRASLNGVDTIQKEAAQSIGLNRLNTFIYILFPQASRLATPSLINQIIDILKSTSLAFTFGVVDIMAKAQMQASSNFKFLESYLAVAIIYWILVIILTKIQSLVEIKLSRGF